MLTSDFVGKGEVKMSVDYHKKYIELTKQYTREINRHKELFELIRDDLRMRSDDGVINLSNFIWRRLDITIDDLQD